MRNYTLDALKFISSFFIIAVHVGYFLDYPKLLGELFRVSTRWALPFFFIVSGYFLGKSDLNKIGTKLNNLIGIFITASLLYLPYTYLQNKEGFFEILFSTQTLFGIKFHLWYLSSLIIAFIFVNFMVYNFNKYISIILSVFLVLMLWISDLNKFFGLDNSFGFFRVLIGIPLVYIGYLTAKKDISSISNRLVICCFFISILFMILEAYGLSYLYGLSSEERQFPLFSFVASYLLLVLGINLKTKESVFSEYGKKYSLGVYLYHLLFLPIVTIILNKIGMFDSILLLTLTFLVTLLFLIILDSKFNKVFRLLNGDWKVFNYRSLKDKS